MIRLCCARVGLIVLRTICVVARRRTRRRGRTTGYTVRLRKLSRKSRKREFVARYCIVRSPASEPKKQ